MFFFTTRLKIQINEPKSFVQIWSIKVKNLWFILTNKLDLILIIIKFGVKLKLSQSTHIKNFCP